MKTISFNMNRRYLMLMLRWREHWFDLTLLPLDPSTKTPTVSCVLVAMDDNEKFA